MLAKKKEQKEKAVPSPNKRNTSIWLILTTTFILIASVFIGSLFVPKDTFQEGSLLVGSYLATPYLLRLL
jgi:hypothetical protein